MLVSLIILFIFLTILIKIYPAITLWDRFLIEEVQSIFSIIPPTTAIFFEEHFYYSMLTFPIVFMTIFFISIKKYSEIFYIIFTPIFAFCFNKILKNFIQRPRPDIDLNLLNDNSGFSYVSTHTLVTFCLWGIMIYFANLYFNKDINKYIIYIIGIIWSIIIGLSRIWIGMHNPTDVFSSYVLGIILIIFIINIRKFFKKYIGI